MDGSSELRMHQCEVAAAAPASVVLQNITGQCEVMHCVIAGDLAFYGMPPPDGTASAPIATVLVNALISGDFQVPAGRGQLVLGHNRLRRLNLGEEMLKQLIQRQFNGLFQTVVLQGNTFSSAPSLCAGVLLTVNGNHFTAGQTAENLHGVLAGRRAAASGNASDLLNDKMTLVFLLTNRTQFRGAANLMPTTPPSI